MMSLDGRQIRLADLRGRRVVLDFWATWCTRAQRDYVQTAEGRVSPDGDVNGLFVLRKIYILPFRRGNAVYIRRVLP